MQRTELIPPQFREGAERMAEAFRHVDQVIVAAHVNPDGDAAGAVAAAGHILRSMGKEFMLYAQPGLPGYLDFFSTPGFVHTTLEHPPFKPRCAVLLDCGEPERLGRELAGRLPDLQTLNIDHHLGGNGMGSVANWVEPQAAATAQLMAVWAYSCTLPPSVKAVRSAPSTASCSRYSVTYRYRKVAACWRVTVPSGWKVVAVMPLAMPRSSAQATASA